MGDGESCCTGHCCCGDCRGQDEGVRGSLTAFLARCMCGMAGLGGRWRRDRTGWRLGDLSDLRAA